MSIPVARNAPQLGVDYGEITLGRGSRIGYAKVVFWVNNAPKDDDRRQAALRDRLVELLATDAECQRILREQNDALTTHRKGRKKK